MTEKKISQLTKITGANLADNDEFAVVDTSVTETKAIVFSELRSRFTSDIDAAVTAAEAAQAGAEAAQAATESLFDQFGDQYLGPKASDPTVDNDGNPLVEGAVYFNTTDDVLKFYSGTAWVAPEAVATTAAANALASEQAAATSESNAATSETNAATSETNAAASASAAAASFDSFDDRYLGAKASAPSVDNDGNALLEGALYWNSTTDILYVWDGASWQNASSFQVGGTASFDDGSASEPALRFSNDLDTGIFRSGTNAFAFTTGGTEAATFEDAGQTVFQLLSSGGDQLLNVDETTDDLLQVINTDDTVLFEVSNTTGVTVNTTIDINGGTIDGTVIGGSTPAAVTGTTITGTSFVTTGDMTFGDNDKAIFGAGSDLQIYHNGSNSYVSDQGQGVLYIQGSNNVQIESATGENMAVFLADNAVELYYDNVKKFNTTATGVDVTGAVSADDSFFLTGASDALIRVTAASGSNAELKLLEAGTGDVGANIQYDGAANELKFKVGNNLDRTRISIARDSGDISFYEPTGTTPKFFWDASAEALGIGVTDMSASGANAKLAVAGGVLNLDDTQAIAWGGGTGRPSINGVKSTGFLNLLSPSNIAFSVNNSERMRIDASGNLLVGTTSSGDAKVYSFGTGNVHGIRGVADTAGYVGVYGQHTVNSASGYVAYFWNSTANNGLYLSNTGAWQSISDARLKEDVRDLDTTERLMQLRPVDYFWKHQATSDEPDRRNLGFIAQEVQQVFPELVSTSPDGMLGVEYTGLISPLVKALQEAMTRIEALEARVTALEAN